MHLYLTDYMVRNAVPAALDVIQSEEGFGGDYASDLRKIGQVWDEISYREAREEVRRLASMYEEEPSYLWSAFDLEGEDHVRYWVLVLDWVEDVTGDRRHRDHVRDLLGEIPQPGNSDLRRFRKVSPLRYNFRVGGKRPLRHKEIIPGYLVRPKCFKNRLNRGNIPR